MRRIFALVLFLLSGQVFAQTDPIVSITISLPPNPDARTNSWGSGTGMFSISAVARTVNGRIDPRVEGSKILVLIKKAGSVICGTFNSNSAPAANFSTFNKVWSGHNAVSLIGQECTLLPGEYELSVQFFGTGPAGIMPLSEEKRKSFSIKEVEQQNYQPPQAISPANGSLFTEADFKKPITFRWTPVIPRPRDGVTYRVRVWQLMEGQNGAQAIIQQPILGNDVGNITQVIVRLKTPPPNQNGIEVYVWNVQALDRDGKPIGGNNGTSELFSFKIEDRKDTAGVCDCGRWNSLLAGEKKYDCGSRILWNCKRPFQFSSTYQCSPNNERCQAKTTWEIRKGDVVIKTGTGTNNLNDGFDLTANGTYTLTLNATCNGKKCPPCIYTIIVDDCDKKCDCGRWGPLVVDNKKYDCGSRIPLNCRRPFQFSTSYQCNPNDENCQAKTAWEIRKGDVVVKAGNGTNTIKDEFTPTANGIYTLTFMAGCGDKVCAPCSYTIVVEDCKTASTVCGTKYNDLNGNGKRESDEPGLPNWSITLSGAINRTIVTDEKGNYCFTDIQPGEYTIKEEMQEGWVQTTPSSGHYTVKLTQGEHLIERNFGNRYVSCQPEQKSWWPLGSGVNGEVRALAAMGSDLYVAGNFTTAGGIPAIGIAKWDGANWSSLGSGLVGGEVQSLLVVGTDLYAGGYFTVAGGSPAKHIAKWNGTSWSALGAGTNGTVRAIAMIGNTLYVGGQFTTAGNVPAKNAARWNGSSWSAMGAGLSATNGLINSFAVQNGVLYAGGVFLSSGSSSMPYFAKWNGSSWAAAATGQTSSVKALASSATGIYVGGALTISGIPNTNKIAKWDGTNWSALGTGTNLNVWSLAVNGSDIYAGGEFTTAGGTAISRIAKWDGTSWSALGTGFAMGTTLAICFIGNDLYAAGNFVNAGGVTVNNIAKFSCSADSQTTGKVDPEPEVAKPKSKKSVITHAYYSIKPEYSGGVVHIKDTLFIQIENNYSSGSNQISYTIRNLSKNKTSRSIKLDIKNNQGLIRFAIPLQNSIVAKGETGLLTLHDSKKYYYMSFKRN